jgi:hypothetical protein
VYESHSFEPIDVGQKRIDSFVGQRLSANRRHLVPWKLPTKVLDEVRDALVVDDTAHIQVTVLAVGHDRRRDCCEGLDFEAPRQDGPLRFPRIRCPLEDVEDNHEWLYPGAFRKVPVGAPLLD